VVLAAEDHYVQLRLHRLRASSHTRESAPLALVGETTPIAGDLDDNMLLSESRLNSDGPRASVLDDVK
jgi:hypothetical protein